MNNAATNYQDKPQNLQVFTFRVDSLEPSTKYEGRWVVQGAIGKESSPVKFWMSHKQMTSIQRNLDRGQLYCVVDIADPEKMRFVWCSNNLQWLQDSFLGKGTQPQVKAPQKSFNDFKQDSVRETISRVIKAPIPEVTITDEDIPF